MDYTVRLVGGPVDGTILPLQTGPNDAGPEEMIAAGGAWYRIARQVGPSAWEARVIESDH